MATLDYAVRRVLRLLEPDEGLLASVLGHEGGGRGRRRLALVATDRRIFAVGLRFEEPQIFSYERLEDVEILRESSFVHLRLVLDDDELRLDKVRDRHGATLFEQLVKHRLARPLVIEPRPRVAVH